MERTVQPGCGQEKARTGLLRDPDRSEGWVGAGEVGRGFFLFSHDRQTFPLLFIAGGKSELCEALQIRSCGWTVAGHPFPVWYKREIGCHCALSVV